MKLIIFLLLFSVCLFGQSDPSPNIKLSPTLANYNWAMKITHGNESQIDSIIDLAFEYVFTNKDTCITLGKHSLKISKELGRQATTGKALLQLGDAYRLFGDLDQGEELLMDGKSIFDNLKDESQIANANNKLGVLYVNRGENDKAINSFVKALAIWESKKDTQNLFKPYLNIAWIYYRLNQKEKSNDYNNQALKWAEIMDDEKAKMYCYNNRAVYYGGRVYDYMDLADTATHKKQMFQDSASMFFDAANEGYERAVGAARTLNDKRSLSRFLGNWVDLKIIKDDFKGALELSLESDQIAQDLDSKSVMVQSKLNISRSYRKLGQTAKGLPYALTGKKIAEANGLGRELSRANLELFRAYRTMQKYDKALEHYTLHNEHEKNKNSENNTKIIADTEAKYQSVQKEKQLLEKENSILELKQRNDHIVKQRNMFIGGGLLLTVLGFFGFRLNEMRKDRNDKKEFAEALIHAQEQERKRIAQDLHDGIGQSLLLIKKQMEKTDDTVTENQTMISKTLEEVRAISRDLHPFQLEKFGLASALKEVINNVGKSSSLFVTTDIDSDIDASISDKKAINIYRTIQEALSNIVKHSGANAAKVSLQLKSNDIIGEVRDNGKGYDLEMTVSKSKSLGLRTMYERISAIGGQLKFEKGDPTGTVIQFSVPKD